ncbi:hypothetical protein EDC94DRAFT_658348 [Helicostylum pulchrum]|nr:hypothetical protein EDC94DRAFT_658348 [Helicostylum pulchrum]
MQKLYSSVDSINPFDHRSELPYIKPVTHKLSVFQTRPSEHLEDWYRTNVYGDLFDFIFSVKSGYESKRFIFTHAAGLNDGLFCEDKSTTKKSIKDNKKAKNFKYTTAISRQFNRLKLRIKPTKIISDVTLHTNLKEVDIPNNEQSVTSFAKYLSTIISLIRMVLLNSEIIKVMIDIAKEDDLIFLTACRISDKHFGENSSCYDDSSPLLDLRVESSFIKLQKFK